MAPHTLLQNTFQVYWIHDGGHHNSSVTTLLLGALEEKDMGLRLVDHVVPPANGLLDAELAPLHLIHEAVARHQPSELFRQDDMSVLKLIVKVLVAVENFVLQLEDRLLGGLLLLRITDGEVVDTARRNRGDGHGEVLLACEEKLTLSRRNATRKYCTVFPLESMHGVCRQPKKIKSDVFYTLRRHSITTRQHFLSHFQAVCM